MLVLDWALENTQAIITSSGEIRFPLEVKHRERVLEWLAHRGHDIFGTELGEVV